MIFIEGVDKTAYLINKSTVVMARLGNNRRLGLYLLPWIVCQRIPLQETHFKIRPQWEEEVRKKAPPKVIHKLSLSANNRVHSARVHVNVGTIVMKHHSMALPWLRKQHGLVCCCCILLSLSLVGNFALDVLWLFGLGAASIKQHTKCSLCYNCTSWAIHLYRKRANTRRELAILNWPLAKIKPIPNIFQVSILFLWIMFSYISKKH